MEFFAEVFHGMIRNDVVKFILFVIAILGGGYLFLMVYHQICLLLGIA